MPSLIKKCVYYAEERAEGKHLIFSITTNGTLITEEIVKFFDEHDIDLMISIDGPKEYHDCHRKLADGKTGSFDLMYKNVHMIKNKFPEYYKKHIKFNMVLDPSRDISCLNEFVTNDDIFSDGYINSSLISKRYSKTSSGVSNAFYVNREYEIFKIYLYELKQLDKKYISKFLIAQFEDLIRKRIGKFNTSFSKLPEKAHHGGPCIPGGKRLFLNADGIFYPCERVSECSDVMKIGDIESGINLEKAETILNVGKISGEQCKNCWAFRYCDICAAEADDLKEFSNNIVSSKCVRVRRYTENIFLDFCTMREYGLDLQSNIEIEKFKEVC